MSRYSKFVVAFLAFAGVIVAQGVLHGVYQEWATAIVAGLGAALVYIVPNTPPAPPQA